MKNLRWGLRFRDINYWKYTYEASYAGNLKGIFINAKIQRNFKLQDSSSTIANNVTFHPSGENTP